MKAFRRTALVSTLVFSMVAAFIPGAYAQTPNAPAAPTLDASLRQEMVAVRNAPPTPLARRQHAPRRPIVRAGWSIFGAVAGAVAGGFIGFKLQGEDCLCNAPGVQGLLIGVPIGTVVGGIMGFVMSR